MKFAHGVISVGLELAAVLVGLYIAMCTLWFAWYGFGIQSGYPLALLLVVCVGLGVGPYFVWEARCRMLKIWHMDPRHYHYG